MQENEKNVVVTDDVSVGEWIITYLIMLIPFVNLVMMFVWAFGNNTKPSKANYFKASLIMWLIGVAVIVIISILFGTLLASLFYNLG